MLRVALLTIPSPVSDAAVAAVLAEQRPGWRVTLLALSSGTGNAAGRRRLGRWLRRAGPGILPYLLYNFGLASGRRARRAARAAGVPVLRVPDVNDAGFAGRLREAGADLIVSLHFDQVIGAATLAAAPQGGVNLHPSILPRHRGPVPAFWALADAAEGGAASGVTVHRIAARVDAGAILAQAAVPLPGGLSATGAARLLHDAGVRPLLRVLDAIAAGTEERGREEPVLPYRPFPDASALRAARRRGVRLLRPDDLLRR